LYFHTTLFIFKQENIHVLELTTLAPKNRRWHKNMVNGVTLSIIFDHINIPVVKYRWQIATLDYLKVVK